MEAALCFSRGDHAGINCQTCLTPPCHLIIACNTPGCWQCWAIDSWHSLKLLIIFSHKPLSDLSTSLYCLWRIKRSILRFQDCALRGKLYSYTCECSWMSVHLHTQTSEEGLRLWNAAERWQFWCQLAIGISEVIRQNETYPNFMQFVSEVIFNLSLP